MIPFDVFVNACLSIAPPVITLSSIVTMSPFLFLTFRNKDGGRTIEYAWRPVYMLASLSSGSGREPLK